MNKFFTSIFYITIITLLHISCQEGTNSIIEEKTDTPSVATTPSEKKILSEEQYRLHSIIGKFAPSGGIYEYDSTKNLWCERPMSADIMSYMKINDIQNIEDVPDLNQYFDEKATNNLNSCYIKITDYGEFKDFSLHYKGNLIYENSLKIGDKNGNLQTFNIKKLNNFDLPLVGSIDFSNGKNYIITIEGQKANILFSNEFGEYEMELLKIRKNNTNIQTQGIATVLSDYAYFHNQPEVSTRRKAFVVFGQQVRYSRISGDFVFVIFFNATGTKTQGWLLKSDLAF